MTKDRHVSLKLTQDEHDYLVKLATDRYEGNLSAALRFGIRLSREIDRDIEKYREQLAQQTLN